MRRDWQPPLQVPYAHVRSAMRTVERCKRVLVVSDYRLIQQYASDGLPVFSED